MKAGLAGLLLSVATMTAAAQGLPHARPGDVGLSPDSLEWIAKRRT